MAEFPTLGQHCAHFECGQLDFLPITCKGCSKVYCSSHYTYESHNCSSGIRSDAQVPVCPLCNQPVPTGKKESADVVVSQHIDNDCQSDPARKKRAYVNACSLKRCKKRELVPIKCVQCRRNFCITHRHFDDHDCTGLKPNPELRPLRDMPKSMPSAASQRTKNDEELARSLQAKLNSGGEYSPEELDQRLAEQLQREEYNNQNMIRAGGEHPRNKFGQCNIS